ncbi:LAME_0H16666g1_1 [Lachancea meyersii CBS 8951]|uniref:LAME_0H16666g1_1 n=1 Tax=Lachancea meyersii CBS 8951 TaxID=1266667 RepID=A0A1G4KI88_9SACH|nr:LAME_0H16666g1_1 [Lachancea meyersii CBS 8951]
MTAPRKPLSKAGAEDGSSLSMFTCRSCRLRKRRCSREKPACERCVRLNIPCVYELPPKHQRRVSSHVVSQKPIDTDTTIANHPLRAHFHTSLELASHVEKDPFLLEYTVAAGVCGSRLALEHNCTGSGSGHALSALTLACSDLLQSRADSAATETATAPAPRPFSATPPTDLAQASSDLVDAILNALPSLPAIEAYKVQFYQNVYTALPALNIQAFERALEHLVLPSIDNNSIELNVDVADPARNLPHLAMLLTALRMGYMSLLLYNERIEPNVNQKQQTQVWLRLNEVSRDVLVLVRDCLQLLDICENPTEDILCCLYYLRQALENEDADYWSIIGSTNAGMLEATVHLAIKMNLHHNVIDDLDDHSGANVTVQEKLHRRKLWLSICSTSLHEHTLRGGNPFVKAHQLRQFSDHHRVFDDYRAISLRNLPSDDQIELDYHIMLLKNHQFMEVFCDIEESLRSNDELLDDKAKENERLELFFKTGFPDFDPAYNCDTGLPLHIVCNSGNVPVSIGRVKQIAVFQTRLGLLTKQLSNSSLLMFFYEKDYKHSGQATSLANFEHYLVESMKTMLQVFGYLEDYAFGQFSQVTPAGMRFVLSSSISPICNRSIIVAHGLMLRLVFLQDSTTLNGETERTAIVKDILAALRALLGSMSECMATLPLPPKAVDFNAFFTKFYDMGHLFLAIKAYGSANDNEHAKHQNLTKICMPGYMHQYSKATFQLSTASLQQLSKLLNADIRVKKRRVAQWSSNAYALLLNAQQ